jgi:hypothetical protein
VVFAKLQAGAPGPRLGPVPDGLARAASAERRSVPLVPLALALSVLAAGAWLLLRGPREPQPGSLAFRPPGGRDLAAKLAAARPPADALDAARLAMVRVRTSWREDAGFLLAADCRLVTRARALAAEPALQKALAAGRIDISSELFRLEDELNRTTDHYLRCSDCPTAALDRRLAETRRLYELLSGMARRGIHELTPENVRPRPRAVLADGSEHAVVLVAQSRKHDLALLRIPDAVCPYLPLGAERLASGARLYPLGDGPSRGEAAPTTFTGFLAAGGERYFATDAGLLPEAAGGPLVDAEGRVVAVTTYLETEEMAVALPIRRALEALRIESEES